MIAALEADETMDDCWQRSPKRLCTNAAMGAGENTATAFGQSDGVQERCLSLREMFEDWTKTGAVERPAMMLSQVKQLLAAVEVRCVCWPVLILPLRLQQPYIRILLLHSRSILWAPTLTQRSL